MPYASVASPEALPSARALHYTTDSLERTTNRRETNTYLSVYTAPPTSSLQLTEVLEGTSRRSRDEILEAAGHHAHVTRRIAGPTATHMRHGSAGGCRKVTGRYVGVRDGSGHLRASLSCAVLAIGKSVLASGKSANRLLVIISMLLLPHVHAAAGCPAVPSAGAPWRRPSTALSGPPPYRPMFSAISRPRRIIL